MKKNLKIWNDCVIWSGLMCNWLGTFSSERSQKWTEHFTRIQKLTGCEDKRHSKTCIARQCVVFIHHRRSKRTKTKRNKHKNNNNNRKSKRNDKEKEEGKKKSLCRECFWSDMVTGESGTRRLGFFFLFPHGLSIQVFVSPLFFLFSIFVWRFHYGTPFSSMTKCKGRFNSRWFIVGGP